MLTDWVEEEARAAGQRRQAWDLINGRAAFDPRQVPEVAAGYFWDPTAASGGDSAGFSIPEGNGKSTYNLITPAVGVSPALGTINGQGVATYTNAAPDDCARTATELARGWTGSTLFAGWFSSAGAPGNVLSHARTGTNLQLSLGASRIDVFGHDTVTMKEAQHTVGAGWLTDPVYVEGVIDFAAAATNRIQLWLDGVQIAPSVAPTMGTSLQDALAFVATSGVVGDSSSFNITATFSHGMLYLCPLPSLADRALLRAHRRLK